MAHKTALNLVDAARALGVAPVTLRRMIAAGAPVARPGRRGRGGEALLDPAAVKAWQASRGATRDQAGEADALRAALSRLPQRIAALADAQFQDAEGPHKRQLAGEIAAFAYRVLFALEDVAGIPTVELDELERLRKVARL